MIWLLLKLCHSNVDKAHLNIFHQLKTPLIWAQNCFLNSFCLNLGFVSFKISLSEWEKCSSLYLVNRFTINLIIAKVCRLNRFLKLTSKDFCEYRLLELSNRLHAFLFYCGINQSFLGLSNLGWWHLFGHRRSNCKKDLFIKNVLNFIGFLKLLWLILIGQALCDSNLKLIEPLLFWWYPFALVGYCNFPR
mgnify:CR=1 FL=1